MKPASVLLLTVALSGSVQAQPIPTQPVRDLEAIEYGQTKDQVRANLGEPESVTCDERSVVCAWHYRDNGGDWVLNFNQGVLGDWNWMAAGQQLTAPPSVSKKSWLQEPEAFRGVKFLSTEEAVRSVFALDNCGSLNAAGLNAADRSCDFKFQVGAVDMVGRVIFWSGAFAQVDVIFRPDDRLAVRDLLIERYGTPTYIGHAGIEKRNGNTSWNSLRWDGEEVRLDFAGAAQYPDGQAVVKHFSTAFYLDLCARADQKHDALAKISLRGALDEFKKDVNSANLKLRAYESVQWWRFRIARRDYLGVTEAQKLIEKKADAEKF
jgi:hypothetical protein